MAQGFGVADAAATQKDYSIVVRGIRFVPGKFSDLETWPFNELVQMLADKAGADKMSEIMRELYRSLKTIFGKEIDPFWIPETSRLTLHTSEILLLGGAAVTKLNDDSDYRASADQAKKAPADLEAAKAKLQTGQAFAGAVAAKLDQPQQSNPAEQDLARQIAEMQRELTRLTNMNTPMSAHTP